MNEAWMDECATRLQPLVDQYKPKQHQTFAKEKLWDLIVFVTTRLCPKKISLHKVYRVYLKNILKVRSSLFSETPCMFCSYASRLIYTIILVQCCNLVALLWIGLKKNSISWSWKFWLWSMKYGHVWYSPLSTLRAKSYCSIGKGLVW